MALHNKQLLTIFPLDPVGLAATVPWLDLLVSLLGAVKMSTLSLMAPALVRNIIIVRLTLYSSPSD